MKMVFGSQNNFLNALWLALLLMVHIDCTGQSKNKDKMKHNYDFEKGRNSLNTLIVTEKSVQPPQKMQKTEEEWKALLTGEQYRILRLKGTERPFTGAFDKHFAKGVYHCAACNTALFLSDTKFDSGCGWPAFFQAIDRNNIKIAADYSHGMSRVEVMCAVCGGHLGHVFEDGPPPTYLRYCINSESLTFKEKP
jgi:peptide-methionine (R)-S-oxide reductase